LVWFWLGSWATRMVFACILAKILLIQQDWHRLFHIKRTIIYHHWHLSGDDGMDEQQVDWCCGWWLE
jgi:hypothetical protein